MLGVLAAALIIVPLAELALLIYVGSEIGVWSTVALLLVVSVVGAVLAKREGVAVWQRFRESIARREVPSAEIVDGFLILLAGALLLTPGFITDVIGLLLLFPGTRVGFKRLVTRGSGRYVKKRLRVPKSIDRLG